MTAERPKQPDRAVSDTQLKLPWGKECTCRKPISFHHAHGRVICVRCRGLVDEEETA
jgi:hypothetical protein